MHRFLLGRLVPIVGALMAMTATAVAQADPEKPVTPPNSYRVVMENDRVRIIEVHIKARSKVEVETPPGRDRFLYMLSDGALILAQPGKAPYEFALNAGETAVFPAVTPYVENDTDAPVRALMVEVKSGGGSRVAAGGGKLKGRFAAKRGSGRMVARQVSRSKSTTRSRASRSATPRARQAAPARAKPQAAVSTGGLKPPLNLSRAAAQPARKITGRSRNPDG